MTAGEGRSGSGSGMRGGHWRRTGTPSGDRSSCRRAPMGVGTPVRDGMAGGSRSRIRGSVPRSFEGAPHSRRQTRQKEWAPGSRPSPSPDAPAQSRLRRRREARRRWRWSCATGSPNASASNTARSQRGVLNTPREADWCIAASKMRAGFWASPRSQRGRRSQG